MASSTPVTVTVCATFQSAAVNVTLAGETVPSDVSSLVSAIATSAVGLLPRTTVNVALPPASVVTKPLSGDTVIPAASSSEFETATSAGLNPE